MWECGGGLHSHRTYVEVFNGCACGLIFVLGILFVRGNF